MMFCAPFLEQFIFYSFYFRAQTKVKSAAAALNGDKDCYVNVPGLASCSDL